jgi:hypothetical protein
MYIVCIKELCPGLGPESDKCHSPTLCLPVPPISSGWGPLGVILQTKGNKEGEMRREQERERRGEIGSLLGTCQLWRGSPFCTGETANSTDQGSVVNFLQE